MIYFDSSALVTVLVERPHATALRAFMDEYATSRMATSTVGVIETVRSCAKIGNFPNLVHRLLTDYTEIPVSETVRDAATNVPDKVRALDAIHIASAELIGSELIALVTYDQRMADAAKEMGLPVAMPGVN